MNANSLMQYTCIRATAASVTTECYAALVDELVDCADGAKLFRVDPAHLILTNSLVSVAADAQTNRIVSGAHAVADGVANIHIQGVATHPAYRRQGIGRTVFANAIIESTGAFGSTDYRLSVRERDGFPTPEAFALYESFSFRVANRAKVMISGELVDAHHRRFAEGPAKDHFYALEMAADIEAFHIAREHLLRRVGGAI